MSIFDGSLTQRTRAFGISAYTIKTGFSWIARTRFINCSGPDTFPFQSYVQRLYIGPLLDLGSVFLPLANITGTFTARWFESFCPLNFERKLPWILPPWSITWTHIRGLSNLALKNSPDLRPPHFIERIEPKENLYPPLALGEGFNSI